MALSDNEPTPVKQLVLDEETREAAPAGADQIAVELSLESLNLLCDVTLDQRTISGLAAAESRKGAQRVRKTDLDPGDPVAAVLSQ
jgi:hypothetical protein